MQCVLNLKPFAYKLAHAVHLSPASDKGKQNSKLTKLSVCLSPGELFFFYFCFNVCAYNLRFSDKLLKLNRQYTESFLQARTDLYWNVKIVELENDQTLVRTCFLSKYA